VVALFITYVLVAVNCNYFISKTHKMNVYYLTIQDFNNLMIRRLRASVAGPRLWCRCVCRRPDGRQSPLFLAEQNRLRV
jgi:predicted phosphohydrolase